MQMEINIKVNGITIRQMVRAYILPLLMLLTMAIGLTIYKKGMDKNHGLMVLIIKVYYYK